MLDALVFGAHPDDAELGMGGTLLRMRDAGLSVGVVDLTAGERGSRGTPQTRAAEADRAAKLAGLVVRETLAFPDTELVPSLELRRAVVEAIRRHRPRAVFAPSPRDLHPDHAAAGTAVRAAFYPSGMRNLAAEGVPYRPRAMYHYPMHDDPDGADGAVVVDVTSVWSERLELARCFASQFHSGSDAEASSGDAAVGFPTLISRPDFFDRVEARARVWGRRAGVELGEPLVPLSAHLVDNVGELLAGERS